MKAVLILALIVLTVNGATTDNSGTPVNSGMPPFFQGMSERLGLTSAHLTDAQTCLNSVENVFDDLQRILETVDPEAPDVEAIGTSLLELYKNAENQVQQDCQAFVLDIIMVLTPKMQSSGSSTGQPTQNNGTPDFGTAIQANWETYFPQIIQQLGGMVNQLLNNQELAAGKTLAYAIQILAGIDKPKVTNLPNNLVTGKYVPFDIKKFVPKFFDSFFKTLGIQANSQALVSCLNLVQNLATEYNKFITASAKLGLFDQLDQSASFYGKFVDTVKGCEGAIKIGDLTIGRIYRAVMKNQNRYLYQIFLNTMMSFPSMQQTAEMEGIYIAQGQYDLAGTIDALRVQAMLKGVVNFATVETK